MIDSVSLIFHVLCFPHEGNIVTINQFSFAHPSPSVSVGPTVPIINDSQWKIENISLGMYSSLMGTFYFVTSIAYINVISGDSLSLMRYVLFFTSYFNDP
jgi:hypothetical protein